MPSSPWPDDLASWGDNGAEPRARLFGLHVELFVNAPSRDRETIRSFEALALGFMPRLDRGSLVHVARHLAPCSDAPQAVLAYLAQRSPETRAVVLELAPTLPASVADLVIGSGPRDTTALAAHPRLDSRTQEKLLLLESIAVDEALAANPCVSPGGAVGRGLIARAKAEPRIGRILLARPDLSPAEEAALYLVADASRRALIRIRIAASLKPNRSLPPRVSRLDAGTLVGYSEEGDVPGLEAALNARLAFPHETSWHCLRPERHEILGLALAALGVEEAASIRIFLTLHPAIAHSVRAVFALTETVRSVPRATAAVLLEAILRPASGEGRIGYPPRHLPALLSTAAPPRASVPETSDTVRPGRRRAG